jgi:hypothetical protein
VHIFLGICGLAIERFVASDPNAGPFFVVEIEGRDDFLYLNGALCHIAQDKANPHLSVNRCLVVIL